MLSTDEKQAMAFIFFLCPVVCQSVTQWSLLTFDALTSAVPGGQAMETSSAQRAINGLFQSAATESE